MKLLTKNLTFKPENEFYLNDVSLEFEAGRLYTILGRTLSGKTSFLKTIAGLQPVDEGEIIFEDKDFNSIPVWERNVAMVYQQFINYPHLNVYENIAFPLKQRKMNIDDIKHEVAVAISQVGLEGFEERKIQELSGGQQQRVALARSLAKKAKILLLDEPLVNLDYKLREDLREVFKNLFNSDLSTDSILIYASTDPQEAMQLNGDIIVIDEGRVLQTGSAKEVFENPASIKVAEITNDPAMNILPGSIEDKEIVFNQDFKLTIPTHLNHLESGEYFFGVRATDLNLDDSGFNFIVDISEISGSETFLHMHQDELKVVLMIEEVRNFNLDDQVKINLDLNRLYVFDVNGDLIFSPYRGN
tara:strand:+ start:7325 stop:8401 length:1077 start_codon:yes stop_codon:yes gene_type:complete